MAYCTEPCAYNYYGTCQRHGKCPHEAETIQLAFKDKQRINPPYEATFRAYSPYFKFKGAQ